MSKRVTETAAFYGMLVGFVGCFATKLVSSLGGITLPVYLDPTIVGMVLNIITLVFVSCFTKVSEEEKNARNKLFVVPESEKDSKEQKITKMHLNAMVILGVVVALVLLFVWAIPYNQAL